MCVWPAAKVAGFGFGSSCRSVVYATGALAIEVIERQSVQRSAREFCWKSADYSALRGNKFRPKKELKRRSVFYLAAESG